MFSLIIITSSTVIVQLISQIARLTPFDRENVFQFWGRGQKFNVKVSKREKVEERLDGVGMVITLEVSWFLIFLCTNRPIGYSVMLPLNEFHCWNTPRRPCTASVNKHVNTYTCRY